MARAIIDSSPLILFDAIGRLDIPTSTYREIIIPDAVWKEVVEARGERPHSLSRAIPPGLRRHEPIQREPLPPELIGLGDGETEAIILALRYASSASVLDDFGARRASQKLGLPVVGSAGLLVSAKLAGAIPAVALFLDRLIDAGLYINERVKYEVLAAAGEAND